MSKLRSVNTHFWSDNYVIDLDPIEKLLFLYLLTNTNTNMLGIYELHERKIAFDTGIDKEMVVKIFGRFESNGRATLCNGYVILHNHLKHQNFNANMGISAISSFNDLPESIKNKALGVGVVSLLKEICKPLKKGSEPIIKGLKPFGKVEDEVEVEPECEGELEIEPENDTPAHKPDDLEDVIKFFENQNMTKDQAEEFYHHFNGQGWVRQNGMAITSWQSIAASWIKREKHNPPDWKKSKKQDEHRIFDGGTW